MLSHGMVIMSTPLEYFVQKKRSTAFSCSDYEPLKLTKFQMRK